MKFFTARLGASATLLLAAACAPLGQHPDPAPTASQSANATASRDNNLALGNPSGATADATNSPNNYLLSKSQYVMSYNRS